MNKRSTSNKHNFLAGGKEIQIRMRRPDEELFFARKDHIAEINKHPTAVDELCKTFGPSFEVEKPSKLIRRLKSGLNCLYEERLDPDPINRLIQLFFALEALIWEAYEEK